MKLRVLVELSRRIDRLFELAARERALAAKHKSPRLRQKRLDRAARLTADASQMERRLGGHQLGLALAGEPDARGAAVPQETVRAVRAARARAREKRQKAEAAP